MRSGKHRIVAEIVTLAQEPAQPSRANQLAEMPAEIELKYLSFLSHDLNNNLSAIHLHLQLLKERLVQSPEFSDALVALDLAEQSICHTTDGMQRLLSRERLRKERLRHRTETIALHELVSRIGFPFRASAAKKGVELDIDIGPEVVVNSDSDLITLVMQNLIGNAVKFSSHGKVRILCRHLQDPGGDRWSLCVCDQGPGIPAGHRTQIFNAFWRGEVRGNQGIGLGLAIASAAAKRLGAELNVESQVGIGTDFHLTFPPHASQFLATPVPLGELQLPSQASGM
jgi:signal transduction histidine kinase